MLRPRAWVTGPLKREAGRQGGVQVIRMPAPAERHEGDHDLWLDLAKQPGDPTGDLLWVGPAERFRVAIPRVAWHTGVSVTQPARFDRSEEGKGAGHLVHANVAQSAEVGRGRQ
jgi:hypothetical protein